jgi:GNAT superfamily N-acetyltransferase
VEKTIPATLLRIEEIGLGSPGLKAFVDFPWKLYRGDPCWTPPLNGELLGSRLLGLTGLLTPQHPYHKDAEVTHFLAWQGHQPAGRISASINHRFNRHYNAKFGFFGHFESINDSAVAAALLDRARDWVLQHGMEILRGPGEYSNATHERQGILIDGFEYPPTIDLTHNPPYYASLVEGYGFQKAKDYHAYIMDVQTPSPESLSMVAQLSRRRRKIETRQAVIKNLHAEVILLVEIYNETWAQNWGFLPITGEEADTVADSLKMVIDPGLVRFAYVNGEIAAVLGAFPDPFYELRPRWKWYGDSDLVRIARLLAGRSKIPMTRLIFFGIRPAYRMMGLDAILFEEVKEYAMGRGYRKCEASLLLEDNDLILNISQHMGAKKYKTWRIYDLPLK